MEEVCASSAGSDQLTLCQELLQGSCMSNSSSREERLREEVISLREELRRLTVRVDRQGDQLSVLEDLSERNSRSQLTLSSISEGGVSEAERTEENAGPAPASLGSYTVVSEAEGRGASDRSGLPYSWSFREEVAREIGRFLARSLSGINRGSSGRERLRGLQSTVYVIVRDYEGVVSTNPVRVLRDFNAVRRLCCRGSSFGSSIFVGFPTIREGTVGVSEAGFTWPPSLSQ